MRVSNLPPVAVVLWLIAGPVRADGPLDPQLAHELQEVLDSSRAAQDLVGVAVAVSFGNGASWSGASGFDDRTAQTPLQADGLFRIASITKTFIAATIFLLQEQGFLDIDSSTVEDILPGVVPRGVVGLYIDRPDLFGLSELPMLHGDIVELELDLDRVRGAAIAFPTKTHLASWLYVRTKRSRQRFVS